MKRKYIDRILAVLALALLLASALMAYIRHTNAGEVYRRYSDYKSLHVSFVKDYRINDSTHVDVTTIAAKDSVGWKQLLTLMGSDPTIDSLYDESVSKGNLSVSLYRCPKGHPEIHYCENLSSYDLVFFSPIEKRVYIFDITDESQSFFVFKALWRKLINLQQNEDPL